MLNEKHDLASFIATYSINFYSCKIKIIKNKSVLEKYSIYRSKVSNELYFKMNFDINSKYILQKASNIIQKYLDQNLNICRCLETREK